MILGQSRRVQSWVMQEQSGRQDGRRAPGKQSATIIGRLSECLVARISVSFSPVKTERHLRPVIEGLNADSLCSRIIRSALRPKNLATLEMRQAKYDSLRPSIRGRLDAGLNTAGCRPAREKTSVGIQLVLPALPGCPTVAALRANTTPVLYQKTHPVDTRSIRWPRATFRPTCQRPDRRPGRRRTDLET
jgi:hypothetical protein